MKVTARFYGQFLAMFLVVGLCAAQAQGFEGILRWKITTQLTKAASKQELADKQELAEALKRMTPAMRAQLLAQLSMPMALPTESIVKVKGGNFLMQNGATGAIVGDILYRKDQDQTYALNRAARTYWLFGKYDASKPQPKPGDLPTFEVTKTAETARILSYLCTKYVVKITHRGTSSTQFMWASPEFKEVEQSISSFFSYSHQYGTSQKDGVAFGYLKDIAGVVLKIAGPTNGGYTTTELVEVKRQPLDAAQFTIPAGFTETKGLGFVMTDQTRKLMNATK